MMKKIVLFFVGCSLITAMVSAQEFTNSRLLNQAAIGYRISFNNNYAKALSMAKSKGWPLSYKGRNGGLAVLNGVNEFGFPEYVTTYSNLIAAASTRANQLWPGGSTGLNLTGSSNNMKNRLGIWEVGGSVLGTHVELNGRITQKDNPTGVEDHATHVAGTMIASGVNPSARGMAFGLQGMVSYDNNNDVSEMAIEGSNIVLSNHSYGYLAGWQLNSSQNNRWEFYGEPDATEDFKFGFYDNRAQNYDSVAYNAPFYLIVASAGNSRDENGPEVGQPYFRYNASGQMVSAGNRPAGISNNDGFDIISSFNLAKNILTVGAAEGIPTGYTRKEDVVMSRFSSWGPTDDGRIKPDLVADGVNLFSSIATSNTAYATFSGTSMSSPNTSGSLLLLQEYYNKLKPGTFLRSATLKGLAIHTADEAGVSAGPDYSYGWGMLNVQKAANAITAAIPSNNAANSAHQIHERTLAQGETFSTTVIATGKQALSATICWTDVKGSVDNVNKLNNRTKKLVNDLDIRITKGSGASLRTYLPWTLDVNNPGFAAVPGDNITDNVERIDMDSTVPGQTYTITVTHKGTLARGSQAYSLVISGVGGTAYCASTSGGGGAKIDSVNFKEIKFGNTTGSKTYTDNTRFLADIEVGTTIPISIRVGTADLTNNTRVLKVFIDYNNNGVFDAGEIVAASGVLTATAQIFNANIAVPNSLTVGSILLMRVVVQETGAAADVLACGTYGKGETQDYRVRVQPSPNDMTITEIVSPSVIACGSSVPQNITVTIKNNGTNAQSNIPLTATLVTGSTTVVNLNFTYPGPIEAFGTVKYTFQSPITLLSATTYTLTVATNLSTDGNSTNNSLASTFTTQAKPTTISAVGGICATNVTLKVNNADPSGNYFWYTTPSGNTPFASGSTVSTSNPPTDKTYYVAKEAEVFVGPANKLAYPQGGYNVFAGNYVKFTNSVPVNIESARFHIGYPGRLKITWAKLVTEDLTTGAYSYNRLSETFVDVYATTPTPTTGAVSGNPAADTGAIFPLNISIPTPGDWIFIVECQRSQGRTDSATIYRNNGIGGSTTYPQGVSNIFTITGNSAHSATVKESEYYYFFYNMKVTTASCMSDRVPVIAAVSPVPVITQQGDSLVSSIASGNLWYLNDTAIINANGKTFKPTKAGKYKVVVVDGFGCLQTSNVITFSITAIADVLAEEIKLNVSPNPNNGVFNLSFEVSSRADLTINILNESGQRVYNSSYPNFTGKFSKQLTVPNLSSAFYLIRIQHNKKTYVKKLLIQR